MECKLTKCYLKLTPVLQMRNLDSIQYSHLVYEHILCRLVIKCVIGIIESVPFCIRVDWSTLAPKSDIFTRGADNQSKNHIFIRWEVIEDR